MAKNNLITIWRIVFTIIIMVFHFDNSYLLYSPYVHKSGWYIGVEFFFIVSGFLLYKKAVDEGSGINNGLSYFVYRYKKLYPYYFMSILFAIIVIVVTNSGTVDIGELIRVHIFEIIGLHGIGLNLGWNNIVNANWFISILWICGLIFYHGIVKWRDTFTNFIIPLIIIISFSFLYRNSYGLSSSLQTTGFYENWGLMRGMADMGLGVMAAKINRYLVDKNHNSVLVKIFGNLGFVFVIILSFGYGMTELDFLYAFILMFSVSVAFIPTTSKYINKLISSRFISKTSKLTLCMYLLHDTIRSYLLPQVFGYPNGHIQKVGLLCVYILIVLILAFVFDKIVNITIRFVSLVWKKILKKGR